MGLLKSAATIGANTFLSRLLGFVRDVLIAKELGSGLVSDAWIAAFRFPNLFRLIFAEGAFNSAFVPLYSKKLEKEGAEPARLFAQNIFSFLLLTLLAITAVVQLSMPYLIYVLTPGFSQPIVDYGGQIFQYIISGFTATPPHFVADTSSKIQLTLQLTLICFPYALSMFLMAVYSAILNTHQKFWQAAFAPTLMNIFMIAALFLAKPLGIAPEKMMAWSVFTSGFAQFFFVFWAVHKMGIHLNLHLPKFNADMAGFRKLFLPGILSGGITQVNLLMGSLIASFHAGAMSYIYYADRIYQFPLGIVGVAISVVLLPALSRYVQQGDEVEALKLKNKVIEFSMFLTLPCSMGMLFLSHLLVVTLFQYGKFTAFDTIETAWVLNIYAFGLPAFILLKILAPAFFARENTKAPMRFALHSVMVNIAFALILFPFFHHKGIAAATVIAAWANVGQLFLGLRQQGHLYFLPDTKKRLIKIMALNAGMAVYLLGMQQFFYIDFWTDYQRTFCFFLIFSSAVVYFLLTYIFGVYSKSEIKALVSRKK